MTGCKHLTDTRCRIVADLSGLSGTTWPAACLDCADTTAPQSVNVVTIGISIAARRKSGLDAADLVAKLRTLLNAGPGTELEKLLAWFASPSDKCGCRKHAAQMNAWGVEGCRANLETIIGWLLNAADQSGWPSGPMTRYAARLLIKKAIQNAEKQ